MAAGDLCNIRIEGGHHLVHRFDHRHLTTQGRVDVCEFEADVATADDRNPAGQPLEIDRFITGEHSASVGLNAGRHEGIRARGNDHVLGIEHPVNTAWLAQTNALGPFQPTLAAKDGDASPFQTLGEIRPNRLHQLIGMVCDLLALKTHRCRVNSKTGEMAVVGQLTHFAAGCQQSLRGNATAVHAGATHIPRLDNGRLEPMLCGVFGGIKPPITCADDDDVVVEAGVAHPDCCVVRAIVARRRSNRRGTAAAATLRDSTRGLCGSVTAWVQQA